MKKGTPIGFSDFKTILEENRYYVDKTALVSAILNSGQVTLLCRPRRFGKSLNLSMLRYFFDKSQSFTHLFEGLSVQQDAETMRHQGQYPVVMLSFKDARSGSFPEAFNDLCSILYSEWARHEYLVGTEEYDEVFADMRASLRTSTPQPELFVHSIRQLCNLLNKHFSAPAIVLIDEYDTPLQDAWLNGYYDKMADFLRKLLGSALKENPNLKRGVLTGILRISKESMFSDLNNFKPSSGIIPDAFSDKFGFTEAEVQTMLRYYDLNGREMEEVRSWYDGYRFGETVIYNPWSIVSYVDSEDHALRPYWVNTSGNELLKRLFFGKTVDIRPHLEALIRGQKITLELSEHLLFKELENTDTAVLNLLFFAGYLRAENPQPVGDGFQYDLSIPNREVRKAYVESISSWLRNDLREDLKEPMLDALLGGDVGTFGEYLSDFVLRVFSFYDADKTKPENFYHAFLLGLLVRLDAQYRIRSNVESGFGRYDICLIPRNPTKKGIILELKSPNLRRDETLEQALAEAEQQIFRQKHDTELTSLGVTDILRIAIAVSGKEVQVREASSSNKYNVLIS